MAHRDIRLKPAKINFDDLILFEDDTLLCINKPVGLPSLEERNAPGTGLLDFARRSRPELKLCHRLDKMTSGCLLFAKTDDAYRSISIQFEKRQVYKAYLGLIKGARQFDGKEVDAPISVSPKGQVRLDYAEGKRALTTFFTEKAYRNHTLLRCEPKTGRTHQIRIHLAYLGSPLVGDLLYSGTNLFLSDLKRGYKTTDDEEAPLNESYVLHADCLRLTHPATEEPVEFRAPHSKNLAICLKILDKYDL